MGQTLTHRSLGSFNSAIISHLDLTNDTIYQVFGRITGRMNDWVDGNYIKTQVYGTIIIMNRCSVMEQCAINMATNHNGKVVSKKDYRDPIVKMGKIGEDVINNIRPIKEKKCIKTENTDKAHRVFDSQDDAIIFGNITLGVKFNKRKQPLAPYELRRSNNDLNPSCEYLLNRMWGISDKNAARMIPTSDEKWCVYWRPSFIKK